MAGPSGLAQILPRRRPQAFGQPARPSGRPQLVGLLVHSLADHQAAIISTVQAVCADVGARLLVRHTSASHPGREQVGQFLDAGADTVVVAGGDGTIRLAAGVLAASGNRCTMGVIAAGSGNVLASALGLRRGALNGRARVAMLGDIVDLDVGSVTCTPHGGGQPASEPFCTMVGAGRDAMSVGATRRGMKHALGPLAYGVGALGQLARPGLRLEWRVDDQAWHRGRYWSVLATNTPLVPGGVVLADEARMDDGLLDVVATRPTNPGAWMAIAAQGLLNSGHKARGLQRAQGVRVQVKAAEPVPVQADGDVVCADAIAFSAEIGGRVATHVGDPRLA